MSYPQIPPFCPMFFEIKEDIFGRTGWWFSPFDYHKDISTWSHDSDFPVRIDEDDHLRPLITCVAYRAWMKERERLQKVFDDTPSDQLTPDMPDIISDASDHAREWEEWETQVDTGSNPVC